MALQKKEEVVHVLSAAETIHVQAFQASQLSSHVLGETINVVNMAVDDFKAEHGGQVFDFAKLKEDFAKFCKDYNDTIFEDSSTKGIFFCAKMLFKVGPESRKVKKDQGDKIYKFVFSYTTPVEQVKILHASYLNCIERLTAARKELDVLDKTKPDAGKELDPQVVSRKSAVADSIGQLVAYMGDIEKSVPGINVQGYVVEAVYDNWVVNVCTYKSNKYVQKTDGKVMNLSVKQASLVAMEVMIKVSHVCALKGEVLLKPLAGAIFDRDEIEVLASLYQKSLADMVGIVNASCQSGGHYMARSDETIACAAVHSSTKNLKVETKTVMVDKVAKQYIRQGKSPNKDRWTITRNLAGGGLAIEFTFAEMVQDFNKGQAASILDTGDVESYEEYKALTPDERLEIRAAACEVQTKRKGKKVKKGGKAKKARKGKKKRKGESDSESDSDSDDDKPGGDEAAREETAEEKEKREKKEKKEEEKKAKKKKKRKEKKEAYDKEQADIAARAIQELKAEKASKDKPDEITRLIQSAQTRRTSMKIGTAGTSGTQSQQNAADNLKKNVAASPQKTAPPLPKADPTKPMTPTKESGSKTKKKSE